MLLLRLARRGSNALASLSGGVSGMSLTHLGCLETQQPAAATTTAAALAAFSPPNKHRRRDFAAAAAGVSNLDPETLRAEAASVLAESDDDGLDDFGGPSFP